jgi:arabinogalactan endo-1,4-beta-galactosidase
MKSSACRVIILLFICSAGSISAAGRSPDLSIRAADISSLPRIESAGTVYYNSEGFAEDPLVTLKNSGVNTIRVRIWKDPSGGHSGFGEVSEFAARIRREGMMVWIAVHYSDTWADPGKQEPPARWRGIGFQALKDSVRSYTAKIVSEIAPDFIQIGNEINHGLLLPHGRVAGNLEEFRELIAAGISGVRCATAEPEVIIHYAGIDGAVRFYGLLEGIDYDIMGISYYPKWHGSDLGKLRKTLRTLGERYRRDVIIAETAYPFTLGWNDWTHNIVGREDQLILPEFPPTPPGQKNFVKALVDIIESVGRGRGLCYWGAELVSFNGPKSKDGSPWENQALYDFGNNALPALEVLGGGVE